MWERGRNHSCCIYQNMMLIAIERSRQVSWHCIPVACCTAHSTTRTDLSPGSGPTLPPHLPGLALKFAPPPQNLKPTISPLGFRTHLPVQYAAPRLKKTEISDPISADQSRSSAAVAGRPADSFAAHIAVAALPLPPPKPAPWGTRFWRRIPKCCDVPVLRRNRFSACNGVHEFCGDRKAANIIMSSKLYLLGFFIGTTDVISVFHL